MKNKMRCISYYFSTLILLVFIGGCVSTSTTGTSYYPQSLETTPVTSLVKVVIPSNVKIVMIDDQKVSSTLVTYVQPGNHTYTFEIYYRSTNFCNGPSYGLPAGKRDVILEKGEASSVVFLRGNYSMDASAKEGQTVEFIFKPEPDCKANIDDYFRVAISN